MNIFTAKNLLSRLGAVRAAPLIAGALFAMDLAPSAKAATVYTYTGNDYTLCGGTYCTGGPYALSVTFVTTLNGNELDNLPITDITATITSFEFTDGTGLTLDSGLNTPQRFEIEISTNASGNIVAWFVGAYTNAAEIQMQTNWDSPVGFIRGADFSETTSGFAGDYGFIGNDPGTWSASTIPEIPEPSTFALLATGLMVLGIVRFLRAGLLSFELLRSHILQRAHHDAG